MKLIDHDATSDEGRLFLLSIISITGVTIDPPKPLIILNDESLYNFDKFKERYNFLHIKIS